VAQTKLGKQIMTLSNSECIACIPVLDSNNMVAVTGTNRRLLVFALSEIPLMKRGQGVVLQKFKDAKLTDITIFAESEGLSWTNSGKARIEKSLTTWRAKRGAQGKLPPTGFPKDNKPFAL
jgi:topoisomerase-4 subunit A